MVPFAPLIENVGLVIGVFSYNGKVFWGFNADYDRVPDLREFREAIEAAYLRLAHAAGVELGSGRAAVELTSGLPAADPPVVVPERQPVAVAASAPAPEHEDPQRNRR